MFKDCVALANFNKLRCRNLIVFIFRPWAASWVLKLHRGPVVIQRLLRPPQTTPYISPQLVEKSISRLQHQSFKKHTNTKRYVRAKCHSHLPQYLSICLLFTQRSVALFELSSAQLLCSQLDSQLCSSHTETDVNVRLGPHHTVLIRDWNIRLGETANRRTSTF